MRFGDHTKLPTEKGEEARPAMPCVYGQMTSRKLPLFFNLLFR